MPNIPMHVYLSPLEKICQPVTPLDENNEGQDGYHIPNLENKFEHLEVTFELISSRRFVTYRSQYTR